MSGISSRVQIFLFDILFMNITRFEDFFRGEAFYELYTGLGLSLSGIGM